jgi:hypothetical protein
MSFYRPIFVAYFLNILLYGIYGIVLVYPARSWNIALVGIILMTIAYNLIHRGMHQLPDNGFLGFLNPHIQIHHNKKYNVPRAVELIIEFIYEMAVTISIPVVIGYVSGEWVVPFSIILYTSLYFAFNHVVFYSLLPSKKHEIHHGNTSVNYIPDYLDHLFGTASDETYEDMNAQIPIILISAIIVHFMKGYFKWTDST